MSLQITLKTQEKNKIATFTTHADGVIVEAHRWNPSERPSMSPRWLFDLLVEEPYTLTSGGVLQVSNLEFNVGDWIVFRDNSVSRYTNDLFRESFTLTEPNTCGRCGCFDHETRYCDVSVDD
jgi:hypothetical protein